MIYERSPWKAQLIRDAEVIERWSAKSTLSERRSFLIEKKVFLDAYIVRKLDDANKISTRILQENISLKKFACIKDGLNKLNNHRIHEFFDLANSEHIDLSARRILNMLIHSVVFMESLDDQNRCISFYFTSDSESSKALFLIDIASFIGLIRQVGHDWPSHARWTRDINTGKLNIWVGDE